MTVEQMREYIELFPKPKKHHLGFTSIFPVHGANAGAYILLHFKRTTEKDSFELDSFRYENGVQWISADIQESFNKFVELELIRLNELIKE